MNLMNISQNPRNDYRMGFAILGIMGIGWMGYLSIKWILKYTGLIDVVNNNVKSVFKYLQNKFSTKPSPLSPKISYHPRATVPKEDLNEFNPAPPLTKTSPQILPIKNEDISLVDKDYPRGVTQYTYPKLKNGENIPQACSFHCAAFVLFMKKHFKLVELNFSKKNVQFLIGMRKSIIDQGLRIRKEAIQKGMEDLAMHPDMIGKFTNAFDDLKITAPTALIVNADESLENLDKEMELIFKSPHPSSEELRYCIVVADGQSFAFCRYNDHQAFLFDSHKSKFSVVSLQQAKKYLISDILHLELNPFQAVDLYHGKL